MMKTIEERFSILYFDDEKACLEVFRDFFGREYKVRIVSTLDEARAALREEQFDIVISDQLMPEIDGLTFLREVARVQPEAFRIMLTGSASLGQVIAEVGAGIIRLFITKPWTELGMRRVLERASMPMPTRTASSGPARQNLLTQNAA